MPPSISKDDFTVKDPDPSHMEAVTQTIEVDGTTVVGLSSEDAEFYSNFSQKRRDRVFRKVDFRLIPMLAILYLISHIDRSNIGNAKIEGLLTDLNMVGVQYNVVSSIFFIPYILGAVPSNILLKKINRPSLYLGTLVICWGIVMTCTGLVQSYGSLIVVRLLLGVFEAGFFPGAIYLASYWYPAKGLAQRISYFYCTSALSSAFSGLLAAAIAQMRGLGGYNGWRWIFIIEGLVSVLLGIACFFFLIDTPSSSGRWLDPEEIRFLELSMFIKQGGRSDDDDSFRWRDLRTVASNWRIYVQAYFLFCQSALTYGINFTLPTIIQAMGYSSTDAQLVTAPPYLLGGITALIFAYFSDRFYWRMPFIAMPMIIVTIAYSIIVSLHGNLAQNKGVGYFAVMIAVGGMYPIQSAAASWNANNLAPARRRAMGIALSNCSGQFGGILGSYMYIATESPTYPTGYGISLALGVSGLFVALLLEWSYVAANRKRAQIADEARAKYTEQELFEMGDKSPLFKYTL